MNKATLFLALIVLFGCTNKNEAGKKNSSSPPEPYVAFVSSDSTELFVGVSPELKIIPGRFKTDTSFSVNGTNLDMSFSTSDSSIRSAKITLICNEDNTTYVSEKLKAHFSRFSIGHSTSKSFDTWILPLHSRPLIEITVFRKEDANKLTINCNIRSYV